MPPVLESDLTSPYGTYRLTGLDRALYTVAQGFGRGWLRFKLGLAFRKLVLRRKRIVDADPLGFRCRFYPHQNLGDRFVLFTPAYYEHEERELLPTLLRPDSVFLDIGANTGFYSLLAARCIGTAGRILAFEPNPVMYPRLVLNLSLNGLDGRVQALSTGLAGSSGEFDLYYGSRQLGGASMAASGGEYHVRVPCRPLLDVLRDQHITRIDVLKIDVEGFEPQILNPFFAAAPRELLPRTILAETVDGIEWERMGYRLLKRTHAHNSVFVR
jgi:FkbM family methyltransferase